MSAILIYALCRDEPRDNQCSSHTPPAHQTARQLSKKRIQSPIQSPSIEDRPSPSSFLNLSAPSSNQPFFNNGTLPQTVTLLVTIAYCNIELGHLVCCLKYWNSYLECCLKLLPLQYCKGRSLAWVLCCAYHSQGTLSATIPTTVWLVEEQAYRLLSLSLLRQAMPGPQHPPWMWVRMWLVEIWCGDWCK